MEINPQLDESFETTTTKGNMIQTFQVQCAVQRQITGKTSSSETMQTESNGETCLPE